MIMNTINDIKIKISMKRNTQNKVKNTLDWVGLLDEGGEERGDGGEEREREGEGRGRKERGRRWRLRKRSG